MELQQKVPQQTIREMFDKFKLNGDDPDSWYNLYSLYTPQALRGIYNQFAEQRSVHLNLSSNTDNENAVNDLINIDQSPINTVNLINSRQNYSSIRRPTLRMSQISSSENPFTNYSVQTVPTVSNSVPNTQTSNTITRLNTLYNRINSIPIRTTSVTIPVSNTITTTANMTVNTTTVFSTIGHPIPAQIPNINRNQRQFTRHSIRVPNTLSSFNPNPNTSQFSSNTFNP